MRIKRDNAPETIRECLAISKDGKLSVGGPLGGEAGSQGGDRGGGGGEAIDHTMGL